MNKDSIISAINKYHPIKMTETANSAAVLALLLYDRQDNVFVLITKRSDTVSTYAGDYCFPGGAKELSDPDYLITAKREVQEELSLEEKSYQIIGQLNDFMDRFGNLVRPYVAIMRKEDFEKFYQYLPDEVAEIFYMPIQDIKSITPDERLERITRRHPSYRYEVGKVIIWGLTASMLVHLGNIIFGLNQPVGEKLSA